MARRDDDYARVPRAGDASEYGEFSDHGQLPGDTVGWPGKRSSTSYLAAPIARKASDDAGVASSANNLIAIAASSSAASLPDELRGRLESSLHTDLGSVRVHTGGDSAASARAVGALAYTTGQDIHFGADTYRPDTVDGQALIAHEVAHTVQQRGTSADIRQDKLEISAPGDAHEVEAEAFAQSFMAGQPASATRVTASSLSRMTISRQVPSPQPQPPLPAPGGQPSATFQPTFQIQNGGLGAGKERTQQLVFRGDTLVFTARVENITNGGANLGIQGKVGPGATCSIDGNVATFRVVVGNMGTPGKPGEAAALVDAIPFIELKPPLANAGRRFQQSYQFKVVADYAWLSAQCGTAGAHLQSAFLGLVSQIDAAYLNYEAAYSLHKVAVDNHGKRKQLEQDILTGILLAGVGGAIGGKVADVLKGPQGVAVATATGDVTKYIVRLGGLRSPNSSGAHGSDTPDPGVSPGTAKAAGVSPERWKAVKEKELADAAKAGLDVCTALKEKMDEAWAQGKTELMDLDPVQIVAPTVTALAGTVKVKTQREYAIDLWRTWIHTYGITAKPNIVGGKTRTDELRGNTAFTDSKLFDDIHSQIGNALDAEVSALRVETAPDPLTEMPGS